ncbi:MAG TPA: twin-arginine translocase TatA/TatE family subunit, partial [Planctomycetota bacterium]|nr:twin-arginine translocase TatA/TatE family subunit [Planctomycetota bacterium]
MSALGLLDVGPIEMLVLALAAIMLFGGDLPDIARRAGRIMGRLRGAANDLTRQFDAPPDLLHLPDPDAAMHRPAPPALPAGAPPAPSSSTAPAS